MKTEEQCASVLFEDSADHDMLIETRCVVVGEHEIHADGVDWKWDGRAYWWEKQ